MTSPEQNRREEELTAAGTPPPTAATSTRCSTRLDIVLAPGAAEA